MPRLPPRIWWGAGALLVVLLAGGAWIWHARQQRPPSAPSAAMAAYVGAAACGQCHAKEQQEWSGSQHDQAMQHAGEKSVLGDFGGTRFTHSGVTSTLFRRDGKFLVNTDGADGRLADFEIKYTFGVYPLQQYLVEFSDGRLQALSIAWESRPREQGGQRWFHLYPNERIDHRDVLHWTRPSQNWNHMCAECHSTHVQKNYDPASDRFHTSYAEINVGCEACHGPGSLHVAWARREKGWREEDASKGLQVKLDERAGVTWILDAQSGNSRRSAARATEKEIEVCALCHSRRASIHQPYHNGAPLLDSELPAVLSESLFFADGQMQDEVYNWAPFLQSKMYHQGVTCSDCHDPHSLKLRASGNAVCTQCHVAQKYDAQLHHHHQPGSRGAQCAACHMPTRTYMVIDERHDHSMRVPRPDLSLKLGTPSACSECHRETGSAWAAQWVEQWYGPQRKGFQTYAETLQSARAGSADAPRRLRTLIEDNAAPNIARATALVELGRFAAQDTQEIVRQSLGHSDPLIRHSALSALAGADAATRISLAAPLLRDPVRAVRLEAASLLAGVPAEQLEAGQRDALERALNEYVEAQRLNADRPDGRMNLGSLYARQRRPDQAEAEFRAAMRIEPQFVPAYVNLADLYREQGRDVDGEKVLREGLRQVPNNAELHHALGLALVRQKRLPAALAELRKATALAPDSARYAYVYAVGLHSSGKIRTAIEVLDQALERHPGDREILLALANFSRDAGKTARAREYAARLLALAPQDAEARSLLQSLPGD
jgi:Tfp pilus assembly protein PilF